MENLCACGCGEPLPRPLYLRGHDLRLTDYSVEDRGYRTPCWIPHKKPYEHGYVYQTFWRDGKRRRLGLHVIAYERANGRLPLGYVIDHLCRVRNCMRADHLEAVTPGENAKRAGKLNPDKVREIRASAESGSVLGERYGVSVALISAVRLRKVWADVE